MTCRLKDEDLKRAAEVLNDGECDANKSRGEEGVSWQAVTRSGRLQLNMLCYTVPGAVVEH
jgi:hypothetical protein